MVNKVRLEFKCKVFCHILYIATNKIEGTFFQIHKHKSNLVIIDSDVLNVKQKIHSCRHCLSVTSEPLLPLNLTLEAVGIEAETGMIVTRSVTTLFILAKSFLYFSITNRMLLLRMS